MTEVDLGLHRFRRIVFFTGAGLSAECGLPTYRGAGGIWGSYDWQEYACQRAFDADPEKIWDFHDERRRRMGAVVPSRAHRIIAEVQRRIAGTRIVTQNIDGLHQRAGATDVIELHGSVWRVRCACTTSPQSNDELPLGARRCPTCSAYRRPDIVWFEDPMPRDPVQAAVQAISECDLLISIGTSGVVFPAADLPRLAVEHGALCVEVNPEETAVSHWYGAHVRGPASASLAAFWPELDAAAASD